MYFVQLLFSIFLLQISLFSNVIKDKDHTIYIDSSLSSQEVLSQTYIFIDKSKDLYFTSIKNQKFTPNTKDVLAYGYSPEFNVWIKILIHNKSPNKITNYLEYGNPLTTNLEFYDGEQVFKDGLFQFNQNRKGFYPTFPITLEPYETKEYYLKASSKITTLIIKLNLLSEEQLASEFSEKNIYLSMFFAAMGILTLYNFFIFLFTKDKNYLYYVLYMIGVILHQLVYTGYGFVHFIPQEIITLSVQYAAILVAFPIFMFAFLVRSFLKISQYPKWNTLLNFYLIFFPVSVGVFLLFDSIAQYRNMFSLLLLFLLIVLTLYATYKKNRQAYFVLVGWLVIAISFTVMYLSSIGFIDLFQYFPYIVEIALVFEAIIFSIALADKINQLQEQKNIAYMELILKQATEKQKLENVVDTKTHELKEALKSKEVLLKELNHRVKNNMQTIVSLIRLQGDTIKDLKMKELLETIQNRINAMGCLHELLYQQTDISTIQTKEYFELLIDELEESFFNENIKINYKVDKNLPTEDAVYCGLIINEFITNSLKYAFKNQKNDEINIEFYQDEQQKYLTIYDNGVGFDNTKNSDGLGLLLMKTLATKQLRGSYKLDAHNGVKVEISWI